MTGRRYEIDTTRNLLYREVAGRELRLDLHRPRVDRTVPLVVYLHGGGFTLGDRADHEAARAQALAARGIAVATVQYRFSTVAPFPAQLEDALAAIHWLRSRGVALRLGVEEIGAWGASAGGHLAALLGVGDASRAVPPAVAAAVTWFPVLDLAARFAGAPLDDEVAPPVWERAFLAADRFRPDDPDHRAANPIANVAPPVADFLLFTGDRDRVVEAAQSLRFHDALVAAGGNSTVIMVGGAGHEDPAFELDEHLDLIAGFFAARLR